LALLRSSTMTLIAFCDPFILKLPLGVSASEASGGLEHAWGLGFAWSLELGAAELGACQLAELPWASVLRSSNPLPCTEMVLGLAAAWLAAWLTPFAIDLPNKELARHGVCVLCGWGGRGRGKERACNPRDPRSHLNAWHLGRGRRLGWAAGRGYRGAEEGQEGGARIRG
jgi:hypothetical protein